LRQGVVELERLIGDLTSDDDGLAEAAVEGLAALGYEALTPLTDLLDSQKTDDRWWAVRALAAQDHPAVPRLLLAVIADDSPDVRQAAILGLRLRPCVEAIPALATALEDVDRLTAHLASDALAACGSRAVESLSYALRSSNPPSASRPRVLWLRSMTRRSFRSSSTLSMTPPSPSTSGRSAGLRCAASG